MPNSYAVEIHAYLSAEIATAQAGLEAVTDAAPIARRYWEGRLEALQGLRRYFADHIDLATQTYY